MIRHRGRVSHALRSDPPRHPTRRLQLTTDLIDKIETYMIDKNTTAKPYRWTYDGTPLKAA